MEASIGEVLVSIIAQFEIGELPVFRPHSLFPFPNVPATKWDRPNRIRLLMAGTCDARSRRQWRRVGRSVKKDAKPIFIMVPNLKRARTGKVGKKRALHKKFIPMPVFRVEDTAGQPLEYKPITIPDLPLIEKARQWGISVKTEPGMFKRLGHYDKDRREILLASGIWFGNGQRRRHLRQDLWCGIEKSKRPELLPLHQNENLLSRMALLDVPLLPTQNG